MALGSVLTGMLLVAALALSAENMTARISSATTAADHEVIVVDYAKQADDARAQAQLHDEMGKSYAGAQKEKQHLDQHCMTVANDYRSAAKELDALAAAHRNAAKSAGK